MKTFPLLATLCRNVLLGVLLWCPASLLLLPAAGRAEDTNIVQQTKSALVNAGDATKSALQNAGDEAKAGIDDLKDRAVDSSPNHYSAGELSALVIIGLAVSAIAGMLTNLKATFMGNVGRLLLGLAGAFIGAFLLRFTGLKLDLGSLVIKYDEVVFAFGGAILLLGIGRLLGFKSRKKVTGQ